MQPRTANAASADERHWVVVRVLLSIGLVVLELSPASAQAVGGADSTLASAPTPVAVAAAPTSGLPAPRLGGYLQAREIAQQHVGLTAVLNRARFSIDGALPSRFAYRMLVETEASAGAKAPATVSLREAVVKWSPAPFAVTAGEFKTPFTREYLGKTDERGLADAVDPETRFR